MSGYTPEAEKGAGLSLRTVAGCEVVFDDEGFFNHFEEWSEEIFEVLARECGIEPLTEGHWQVVRFLRGFYEYNGRAPLNNELRKGTAMSLLQLDGLFPEGLRKGARRLAGLPNPKTCA